MKPSWPLLLFGIVCAARIAAAANAATNLKEHWAFKSPVKPTVPRLQSGNVLNPIDAFIQDRLSREGLTLSPEANRSTLIRRASLDLAGLPPSPAEVDAFLGDGAPDAYDRLVERLLASPHYGERWGRWWLDAARYADSNGYSIDSYRSVWPYRDWVVRALNADLPFDQFTIWQVAGDLLPGATPDQLIATGFHRNTQVNHEGGIDTEHFRVESAVDRVNTTATVWLGLTLGCAQCHDHKYDPLTQRDYYRFFAFFNQQENDGHGSSALEAENTLDLGSTEQLAALAAHRNEVKRREAELKEWVEKELKPRQPAWETALDDESRKKLKPEVLAALALSPKDRNEFQAGAVFSVFRDQDAEYKERRKVVAELRKPQQELPTTLVMREHGQRRESFVMIKGDFTRRGALVDAGIPAVLENQGSSEQTTNSLPAPRTRAVPTEAPQTNVLSRLDLARWLVSTENPLTSRVMVNRIWQVYFGKGLVETENDFGRMGTRPSHPELLDWLATEFIARGWSMKAMHRLIVTSATYRQKFYVTNDAPAGGEVHEPNSVTANPTSRPETAEKSRPLVRSLSRTMAADPQNKLLWRQNRLRLDAELIRDVHLAASGLLDARLGGPPVFPPQPDGLDAFTQNKREWKTSTGGDRYRRALYTHLQRTRFHPALSVFDAPDAYTTCTRRLRSNTPLQALTLLNDQQFIELALGFASRIQTRSGDDASRLTFAFRCCVSREPDADELKRLSQLVKEERTAGEASSSAEERERRAWLAAARVLLNLDETITRE